MEPILNKVDLARELGRETAELRNELRQFLQKKIKESNWDISFELLEILGLLYKRDGMIQQEIADILIKDKSSVTYLITNLVKRDLVERTEDQTDRRNKQIFLKAKGRELIQQLGPWVEELYTKATQGIPVENIALALAIARKMNENLKL
ncbi:DNA phosphorothioation-dependent restriction protein DptG [Chitinophaga dinghuensis]|uniref:DNA phosphorothioation-dependent restriction protein DptG n=1 Tax=Chitinophaga dinghuensis TaxID=1539050 RepID=A0A327W134_9BACT|nr:MarR family transcriptional regulator [Chitinophaga dinghuensis]RAJ81956.1 DNA phosphorothioation-dependent restriction protein DptG [Chitinophaga dinghuensis]